MAASGVELIIAFFVGLVLDFITAGYVAVPIFAYCLIVPDRLYRHRWHAPFLYVLFFAILYIVLFTSLSEWFFWEEFNSRFNFIAVDYLVYTSEVLGNIRESYPVGSYLLLLLGLTVILFVFFKPRLDQSLAIPSTIRSRTLSGLSLITVPILSLTIVDASFSHISENRYVNELASNGIYSFFSAFRANSLDYKTYYRGIPETEAWKRLQPLLAEQNSVFDADDPHHLTRYVHNEQPALKLNVVLITVESLSAEYLGVFGNTDGLTPNLDDLAAQGMIFTNLYATGTRTVRGLEALTLSVPPTPGRSIVKRPGNENLFSIGQVFRNNGYDTKFMYGGFGYFDNMNQFFSSNGFDVIDRADFRDEEIHFANVWGVADEDLYSHVLLEMDKSYKDGKPFFHMIMTTSNHRPYTYPEGRIDIPSHTGRYGAVKYTDYAIGELIKRAKEKPWFKDTVFVIVADHCASSAGKAHIQHNKYKIPMIVYSPHNIEAKTVDVLASQIDVAPTILGLLRFSYKTKFFGHDLLKIDHDQARALFGNYQLLGYFTGRSLTVLSPMQGLSAYTVEPGGIELNPSSPDANIAANGIAYYETASLAFENHYSRWDSAAQ